MLVREAVEAEVRKLAIHSVTVLGRYSALRPSTSPGFVSPTALVHFVRNLRDGAHRIRLHTSWRFGGKLLIFRREDGTDELGTRGVRGPGPGRQAPEPAAGETGRDLQPAAHTQHPGCLRGLGRHPRCLPLLCARGH